MAKTKYKYYTLDKIDSRNAHYNIIFGERSNGKTYAVLKRIAENYLKNDKDGAIIRRWQDDFKSKRGQMMFAALADNGEIEKLSGGAWDHVDYYAGRFYMACYQVDEKGLKKSIRDDRPFCYAFALSAMEHDKSTSYPRVTTILFDEFITRDSYFNDEFILFMNTLSTIARLRKDIKIYMLGNTVNKYCPYFAEMGLTNIKQMHPGDIDVYKYGDSDLKVAVEYADNANSKNKDSNILFAFNNPKLAMISHGAWEIDIYPHLPMKYTTNDILFTYFIIWQDDILQCEIVHTKDCIFTYVHRKTTEIKDPDTDIVFTTDFSARPNYYRNIKRSVDRLSKQINSFFSKYKVFYQDNEVGEIIRNYCMWCDQN